MRPIRVVLVLLLSLAPLASAAGESPVVPFDKWRSMRTPNFQLIGDVGEGDLRRVATRLEQFRDAVGKILPRATVTSATPTVVIVFKSHKNFRPFKPHYQGKPMDHVAGYFQPGQGLNFVTLTTESRTTDTDEALRIVYHELVHLMVRNSAGGIPPWLNEGLAEYFRMLDIASGGRQMVLGRVQSDHVFLLRERFIPLDQLVAVDHSSPLYNEGTKASIFYAESWALVHYLLINDMVNGTSRTSALLQAIAGGASFADACQKALGMTVADLEKTLRNYVGRDSFTSLTLKLTERIEKLEELPATAIEPAEAHATIGTLLLQMSRRDEARAHLEAALSSAPAHALALSSMGSLLMREGKRDEARTYLERASASPDATAAIHYQHAAALHESFDAGAGRPNDVDVAIEAAYRRAIALDQTMAESYAGLARLLADRGHASREPLDLMMKAIRLEPGQEHYRLSLGFMLSNREAFGDARTVLMPLASGADDEGVRSSAASLLKRITEFEEQRAELERRRAAAGAVAAEASRFSDPVMIPDLRPKQSGEEQIFGVLAAIECPRGVLRLVVKDGEAVTKVRAKSFDGIAFISFRPDLAGAVSCGPRNTADPVLVTYRPASADGTVGEVVAVEFVPLSYRHTK